MAWRGLARSVPLAACHNVAGRGGAGDNVTKAGGRRGAHLDFPSPAQSEEAPPIHPLSVHKVDVRQQSYPISSDEELVGGDRGNGAPNKRYNSIKSF